jgi:hypothetical protein
MKPILTVMLGCALVAASAPRVHADDPAALGQARSWMAVLLDRTAAPPTATKAAPLEYLTVAKTRSCRPLRAGRAIDAAGAARVKTCLVDAQARVIAAGATVEPTFVVTAFDTVTASFPAKQRKKMAALAKDATIVNATYQGGGATAQVYLVLGADGAVRGLWMIEHEVK